MIKRLAAGALILAVILSLSGCGQKQGGQSSADGGAKKRKIVFVFKLVGISYANACEKGMKQAAKDLGVECEFIGPSKGGDIMGQINMIEDQISKKVDAIVISPNDAEAVIPVIEKATKAGIKVFTWDSDAPKSKRLYYVAAADDVGIGTDIIDALAKDMGGKGKVAIMTGGLGALNLNLHVDGVKKGLSKYPNIQLVEPLLVNNDQPQQSVSQVSSILQAHPDLGGIACVNSPGPPSSQSLYAGEERRTGQDLGSVSSQRESRLH
jgi:ABC-type sugar transport system substrate-binding protein